VPPVYDSRMDGGSGSGDTMSAIVSEAYRVFSSYSIASRLRVCLCSVCMTEETEAALVATDLRRIPSALLAEYTNSAHAWDDVVAGELRYFLPRYLELIAKGDHPDHNGPEGCLRRLGYANWRECWPQSEVDVLDRFFDRLVLEQASIATGHVWPRCWRLDLNFEDAFELASSAGADVGRLFDAWWKAPDPQGAVHLAHQRSWHRRTPEGERSNGVRGDADVRVRSLLSDDRVTDRVRRALASTDDVNLQFVLDSGL
jgi:hypothetical protein